MNRILIFVLSALLLQGCFINDPIDSSTVVLLEDVIYTSSNDIRVLGRIYSLSIEVDDYGFEFSTSENFENAQTISLGSGAKKGLFFAEYDSLKEGTNYFLRAYILGNGSHTYSETKSLTTFKAQVTGIAPLFGKPGSTIDIIGTNFTNETKVFFGNEEATISHRSGDYKLEVEVPGSPKTHLTPVYLEFDGRKVLADTFEYVSGKWTMIKEFQIGKHFDVVQFKNGDQFTIGFGNTDNFNIISNKFYTLDLNTLEWTESDANGPTPITGSFYTNNGYFGSGSKQITRLSETEVEYNLANEFWKYTDGTFTNMGMTPYSSQLGIGFELNDVIYMAGGMTSSGVNLNYLYKFEGGKWTKLSNLPFPYNNSYPHLNFNSQHIFLTPNKEYAVFDPNTEKIEVLGEFPRVVANGGILMEVNNTLYVGLFDREVSFYRMEIDKDNNITLTAKNSFPGDKYMKTVANFEHNGNIYIIRATSSGADVSTPTTEFWKFEPTTLN